MRRVRNKRLKRNIVAYMKHYKMIIRYYQRRRQKWEHVPLGWRRNVRPMMIARAYAFQLRRKNDSRK